MEMPPPPPNASVPGSVWPKTLGIISIIFGVGGLLQAIISPLSLLFTRKQMNSYVTAGVDQARVDDYLDRLTSISYLGAIGSAILGLVLLTGGILLIKRRRVAPVLLQVWGALKILVGGAAIFMTTGLTSQQMSIIMDGTPGAKGMEAMNQITSVFTTVGMVFGFLWLCALPVFFFVWFNRRKISDQIKTW